MEANSVLKRPWLHSNIWMWEACEWGFPGGSDDKVSVFNEGNPGLIPGLGRSPGEGNGSPLQYSCLENPMGEGTW